MKGDGFMELKETLVQSRKVQGLSQEDLAARIGVSRQAVSKWETGDALPDLPRLLALAETLDMSLDALCGREAPSAISAPELDTPAKKPALHRRLVPLFLAILLLAGSFFAGTQLGWSAEPPAPSVPPLPETVTVSGVNFSFSANWFNYQLVPSVAGEEYTYQITFNGYGIQGAQTFDVAYSGGFCSGSIYFKGSTRSYTGLALVISNGKESRAVPLATNLSFSGNTVTWTPIP